MWKGEIQERNSYSLFHSLLWGFGLNLGLSWENNVSSLGIWHFWDNAPPLSPHAPSGPVTLENGSFQRQARCASALHMAQITASQGNAPVFLSVERPMLLLGWPKVQGNSVPCERDLNQTLMAVGK